MYRILKMSERVRQGQLVNPADVRDGYHIPSGRRAFFDAKTGETDKPFISDTGYSISPSGKSRIEKRVPQPYIPGASSTKTVLNKPEARKAGGNPVMDFFTDNFGPREVNITPGTELKYTPSSMDTKVREVENAIGQFVPDFIKDFGNEQGKKGFAEALIPGAVMNAPGLGGLLPRTLAGGAAGVIAPMAIPGAAVKSKTKTPIKGFDTLTPEETSQALRMAGTDTSSGNREVTRVAQTDNMDDNMKAWAAANPELAKRMVAKTDKRRETNPDFKQSGYEAVRNELYPGNAALAAEQNQGDFSVRDAVGGKMSPEEAGAIASGGFVETVFDKGVQGESKITNNSAEKATDLLSSYKKGLIGKAGGESEASELQNPVVPGGDGTPDGAINELQEKTVYEAPASMIGLPLDQVNSKMKQLGGDEYLRQLDAGRFGR